LNQDCSLKTACEYKIDVPAPPAATIIDVLFSFGFNANAPCVGLDGAFSFAINGGCSSQMWVGTDSGTGSQYFTNQSMLLNNGGGLGGCFPKSDKGDCEHSQNIPFTFNFFRKCHGPDGCDGSCIGAAEDLTITLVGRTFDFASLSASPQSSCAGAPVTLTARAYYGIPPYNFVWQGLPQYNGDSVIQVNPTANASYAVQISDVCSGPITKSINVNVSNLPTPVFTSNSPVCTGGQLILSAPSIPGITYFIENPSAGLGGGQYASTAVFNNVTAAYAGTWITVASDTNGCTSDTASTIVVINPAVSPTVQITSSATNICAGAEVSFTATVSNAGNSPNYQWLLNGKNVGTNSPVYSGTSFVNNDAVSCVVSAPGPCAGSSGTSNIIVLNVSAVITLIFDEIGPLCQNSTPPVLPPTSREGIAGTWSPASINTSAIGTATYIFTPSSAGSCATPASLNITIVGSISPTFPTIADSYCLNDIAPALPPTSKEGVNGTWNPSSINTATVGPTLYTFTPAAGQCGTSSQITIVINPLPALTMGPDLTIAAGASTTLNVSVTGNIVSYQWKPSIGLNNATIKDPVASPSSTTVYTLVVTDDNKCETSDSIKITVAGGTSKILVPNAFSPNGDGINDTWIISNLSAYPGATVDVFNRYGQLVFHSENYNKAWDGTYNGNPLPMGTYYYIIDLKNNEKKMAGSVTIFK
jgi:gliding motility-associated-like protein